MLGFVLVKDAKPEDGRDVEVIRDVSAYQPTGFLRYTIERSMFSKGLYLCDSASTGRVVAWRYAEEEVPARGYRGLDAIPEE